MRLHHCLALCVSVLLLAGCGSRTYMAPSEVVRTISGNVDLGAGTFTVAPDEVVEFSTDVVVRAGSATVDGTLRAAASTSPGAAGHSITIATTGDVAVTGSIAAGAGVAGTANGSGGDGGAVVLRSTAGDISLGAAGKAASIAGGNGGAGGAGALGGADGAGGGVTIEAPAGTLAIVESEGLIRLGDGGSGGTAVVGGADLLAFSPPEQWPNSGGDAGRLAGGAKLVSGAESTQFPSDEGSVPAAALSPGVVSGGTGGSAGDVFYGVDPRSGDSTWPQAAAATEEITGAIRADLLINGAHGGAGLTGGKGGSVTVDLRGRLNGPGEGGLSILAIAGSGGDGDTMASTLGFAVTLIFECDLTGGPGGTAIVRAQHGGDGAPMARGGDGGWARAEGGFGGSICDPSLLSASNFDRAHPAIGGDAWAYGGNGGHGGAGPNEGDPGGQGGEGGWGQASAGLGGCVNSDRHYGPGARSGRAVAYGGNGGNGGDGGKDATGGGGGVKGKAETDVGIDNVEQDGIAGKDGKDNRGSGTDKQYRAFVGKSTEKTVEIRTVAVPASGSSAFAEQADTVLGGSGNPIDPVSFALSSGRDRLWVMHGGDVDMQLRLYPNPLSGGDRAPSFSYTADDMGALWLDETHDRLYTCAYHRIMSWAGASTMNASRAPDTVLDTAGAGYGRDITSISGDPLADQLFAVHSAYPDEQVLVFDGISSRFGSATPDRVISGIAPGADQSVHHVAYDSTRDILYAAVSDTGGNNWVAIIDGASMAQGTVTPRVLTGAATGLWTGLSNRRLMGVRVDPEANILFVGAVDVGLFAYTNASTLSGDVAPALGLPITAFSAMFVAPASG